LNLHSFRNQNLRVFAAEPFMRLVGETLDPEEEAASRIIEADVTTAPLSVPAPVAPRMPAGRSELSSCWRRLLFGPDTDVAPPE
jgi:hypothetical protein